MKKVATITIVSLVCLAVAMFMLTCGLLIANPYITHNTMLKDNIAKLSHTQEFEFNTIIPFEWDEMYVFTPGTSKEYIEETINISHSKIYAVPEDAKVNTTIFVKDGKITAYMTDAENINFNVYMETENHGVISYNDWYVFVAENKDGIVNISDMMLYRDRIMKFA